MSRQYARRGGSFLACAACTLLCLSLRANAAEKQENWTEIHSPNFIVVSNAGEKNGRRVAEQFEQFRAVFQTVLPKVRVDPGQPVIILAVKNEKSLKELIPKYWETKGSFHPAGVFVPGPEKHYAALRLDISGENPYRLIYHEYVHLLVNLNFDRIPVWLNEGLAEFYGNTVLGGVQVGLGRPSEEHVYLLNQKRLLPLAELLTADHTSPYYNEENKASIFYAQSWALTHYLMIGEKGVHRQKLVNYLTLLQEGVNDSEAARRAFGDLKTFEKQIEGYVRSQAFYYVPVKPPADIDEKKFAARELPAAEVAAATGDFYVHTNRPAEARARLEQAIQLDPKLAAARESMGILSQHEGKMDEALRWFAEAVDLDSKSFLAHYLHAILFSQGILALERIEQAEKGLRRAIELRPNFAPAYAALAQFYAVRSEKLEEALTLARKSVQLEPGTLTNHLAVANVLLRMERVEEAQKLAQRVLAAAKNPADRMAAQSLLEHLKMYEAQLAERKRYEEDRRTYEGELKRELAERKQREQQEPAEFTPEGTAKAAGKAGKAPVKRGVTAPGEGVVTAVNCEGKVLSVTLSYYGSTLKLHADDYAAVEYLTLRWQPPKNFNPCTHLKGRDVRVEYRVMTGRPYAGELVSMEIRK